MSGVVLGSVVVGAEASQVGLVRRWLRGVLGTDHPVCGEAELLGSELVTNAILHSDSGLGGDDGELGTVSVAVLALDGFIRVEVTDAGSAVGVPEMVEPSLCATSGRGLRMVYDFTGGRCGARTDDGGRTVWFELAHPPVITPNGDRP
jgi:anti-sigma regulatory factor (Ser/Thr protein kinase)